MLAFVAVLAAVAGSVRGAEFPQIDPAGWKDQAALPEAVSHQRAIALTRALLSIGGQDRHGRPVASVYRSSLSGNGECGAWVKEAGLPAGVSDHAASEAGGFVYVTGGLKAGKGTGSPTDEIWVAAPGADGRVSRWSSGGRLPEPLQGHVQVTCRGRIYVIGGTAPSGCRSSVWLAAPGARIAGWKQVTPLPVPLVGAAATSVGNYLIVLGGQSPGSGKTLVMPTVYVGPVFEDGTVPTWYLASSKLPGPWLGFGRCQAAAVTWRNSVFCIGGQDPLWFLLDSIAAAAFDPEKGETTGWGVTPGPEGMHQLCAAVVWKDSLYLVGGTVKGEVTAKVLRGRFGMAKKEEE